MYAAGWIVRTVLVVSLVPLSVFNAVRFGLAVEGILGGEVRSSRSQIWIEFGVACVFQHLLFMLQASETGAVLIMQSSAARLWCAPVLFVAGRAANPTAAIAIALLIWQALRRSGHGAAALDVLAAVTVNQPGASSALLFRSLVKVAAGAGVPMQRGFVAMALAPSLRLIVGSVGNTVI